MNHILSFFQSTFQNEFQTTMTGDRIAIGLLVSFFLTLYIVFVYKVTYQGVSFNRNFAFSLILLSMVTSTVIMTVTTNLTLSLGMVGALSIVRFRTAVKDPTDTVFMFWAITVGIMSGAGLVYIALITNICLGLICLVYYFFVKKRRQAPYLLVIRYKKDQSENVELALGSLKKLKVRSKIVSHGSIELCLEATFSPQTLSLVDSLGEIDGVLDASLVSFDNENRL